MNNNLRAVYHAIRSLPKLGLIGSLKLLLANITSYTYRITPIGYNYPLLIRGGGSDSLVFFSVFCLKEYPLAHCKLINNVIDAGANAGYASIYFAHHFPDALIIAIEPDNANYELLVNNTIYYSNIKCINAALWHNNYNLYITNPEAQKWSYKTAQINPNIPLTDYIRSITINDIMLQYNFDTVDLLKIDIEGAEQDLFENDTTWLKYIRNIMIEIHPDCWKSFFNSISQYNYHCWLERENLVIEFINE